MHSSARALAQTEMFRESLEGQSLPSWKLIYCNGKLGHIVYITMRYTLMNWLMSGFLMG